MRRRPDLIVPIRDRRQRKRYVTLKNVGIALAVVLVVFVAISIRSEMHDSSANYGRLVEHELPPQVEQKPVEVVKEASIEHEQTHADPMLTAPMARAQWLEGDLEPATPVIPPTIPPRTQAALTTGESDVAIVGGPEGVVVETEPKPRLKGGFGRP